MFELIAKPVKIENVGPKENVSGIYTSYWAKLGEPGPVMQFTATFVGNN